MRRDLSQKGVAIGVTLSLILLIIAVFTPSYSAVKLSPGTPNTSSVTVDTTIIFQDVNLTIRSAEAIPVNSLMFSIFRSNDNSEVAHVNFSLIGTKLSDNPLGAFTVINITNTSHLPYQSGGNYYGYDERTGQNVTGFNFGYGDSSINLSILYRITYKTHIQGTFYAKLFVNSTLHTYISEKSTAFTVVPSTTGGGGPQQIPSTNQAPVAHAGGPYNGYVNQSITFNGSKSTDDNGITGYRWDWTNNGTWDTGWLTNATTTHIYTAIGVYIVKLEVKDSGGLTSNDTATVIITTGIPQYGPVAEANGPYTGLTFQSITFSAYGSSDLSGTIVNYTWDFGDGIQGYGIITNHTYQTAGTFTVSLKVIDNKTRSGNDTTIATILLDSDRDGVSDKMEQAVGANISLKDIRPFYFENTTYYFVDINGDGIYDVLYNPITNTKTSLGHEDGDLLIDINGDGTWDYVYNPVHGTTSPYKKVSPSGGFPWMTVGVIIVVLVIIVLIILLYLKRNLYI